MEATDDLNDGYIIGKRAYRIVYKASLAPGGVYAVKKLMYGSSKEGSTSMVREIETVGKVYPPPLLDWSIRCNIALGIAHGLAYLHFDCDPPIVHRDIKPMNILLDAELEPSHFRFWHC
ncbi:putative protein kinase RLK-Pelle-LRR-XI-1 family [Helianthus annuus]|uniref:non-specific serine/threonine protein kinase n=1 Tax=Helianthus annuus TaxID=4232 RepID=A0A251TZ61_HELAN|nr:putative protein kinase RLK-Pelle-LRR-XI-1 family [Helianthus annuus]KAJ0527226.1 putative protein kinase RLK-Pelle-LRR-XI-1 family [Helianthus annuus]KAJ0535893.1 putative protein kinase RLK-Pelle-LRR-XI-1 family [Helianthus annuus]KAJ0543629.1 putative protein kinase RLK-Pelle-LRR-XI-1 family [Helianthus annuus]KAJ0708684.1 putative protein kinase RLK-Pelle-LRR-XI-1 family [Helianthus annuus]